jgi:hypothetical protein
MSLSAGGRQVWFVAAVVRSISGVGKRRSKG